MKIRVEFRIIILVLVISGVYFAGVLDDTFGALMSATLIWQLRGIWDEYHNPKSILMDMSVSEVSEFLVELQNIVEKPEETNKPEEPTEQNYSGKYLHVDEDDIWWYWKSR